MGVNDIGIIGVGKDSYNEDIDDMVSGRILPWVEDSEADGFPVWEDFDAVQRSTYFLDRNGDLLYQFNITTLDPNNPADYNYLINLILDYRASNGPDIIRVTHEGEGIQNAINNANNGDIILVEPGVYIGQINFLDKNITLASLLYSSFEESGLEETILDGGGEGPIVRIDQGQDQSSILLGFIIEYGDNPESGGGILIEDSSPTIDRNVIRRNHAGACGGSGGGIAILGDSYPHIFGNLIYENSVSGDCDCLCYFGGGIYVDRDSWPIVGGSITLGNTFYDNTASDFGNQLFRDFPDDTTNWSPIYAHHNTFEYCPPQPNEIYPVNGWDTQFCHYLESVEENQNKLNSFNLFPSFPNPFNPITNISFYLEQPNNVEITIFDINGRTVKKESKFTLPQGSHIMEWDAGQSPSGVYFIQVISGHDAQVQKVILVK